MTEYIVPTIPILGINLPSTIVGGQTATLAITLSPAAVLPLQLDVVANDPTVTIGSTLIPQGATTASIPITTQVVTSQKYVTLTITVPAGPMQYGLTICPVDPQAALLAYAASKVTLVTDDPSTWSAQRQACAAIPTGLMGDGTVKLGSFIAWAPNSAYRQDISGAPVDPNSDTWIASMGGTAITLSGPIPVSITDGWQQANSGIPVMVVDSSQTPLVNVRQDLANSTVPAIAALASNATPNVSDPGPFPIPLPPVIQGTRGPGNAINWMPGSDQHLFVLVRDLAIFIEMWLACFDPNTNELFACQIAVFDLIGGDCQRPYTWTSSSASGCSQFAGQISPEEAKGGIQHALAFTAFQGYGRLAFCDPATAHQWNNTDLATYPPLGARMRLKASFDINATDANGNPLYNQLTKNVWLALQKYGSVYVDGGHPCDQYYGVDSAADPWDPDGWGTVAGGVGLDKAPIGGNFEFVTAPTPYYSDRPVAPDVLPPTGPAPAITHLEVYPTTVSAGQEVIVFWETDGTESMRFISGVGPTRKNFAFFTPTATETITLTVQNKFGRNTQSVTVTVG